MSSAAPAPAPDFHSPDPDAYLAGEVPLEAELLAAPPDEAMPRDLVDLSKALRLLSRAGKTALVADLSPRSARLYVEARLRVLDLIEELASKERSRTVRHCDGLGIARRGR